MDYGGGNVLRKYQWDYIHHPRLIIPWLQDDEGAKAEGGIWFSIDEILTDISKQNTSGITILDYDKYNYKNTGGDQKQGWKFKHNSKFYKVVNSLNYSINKTTIITNDPIIYVKDDFDAIVIGFKEQSTNKIAFEYQLPNIGTLKAFLSKASIDIGRAGPIITKCTNFIKNTDPGPSTEEKFQNVLLLLEAAQLAAIDIDKSLSIMQEFINGGLYKEEELICLNLLGLCPDSKALIGKLKSSKYADLIKELDNGFDDTFGDDNYSTFTLVVNSHVLAAKKDEIGDNQTFISAAQQNNKAYRLYKDFQDASSKPCRSQIVDPNSGVELTMRVKANSRNDVWEKLAPIAWDEPIALYLEKDITALGLTKGDFEIMPAYMFHSIIQHEHNEALKEGLLFTVDLASMGFGVGEILGGVRGVRMVFAYCDVAASLADIGINKYEDEIKEKWPEDGADFIAAFNKISILVALGDIGSATLARLASLTDNEVKLIADFHRANIDELRAMDEELEQAARRVAALEDENNWEALARGEDATIAIKNIIPPELASKLGDQLVELENWLAKYADELPEDATALLDDLTEKLGGRNITSILEGSEGRFIVQCEGSKTNAVFNIMKTHDGTYSVAKFEPAYKPIQNPDIDAPLSYNKQVPDYSQGQGRRYLCPESDLNSGQLNIVEIRMTGYRNSRVSQGIVGDFETANIAANFGGKTPPKVNGIQYTWHHMDDFRVDANGDMWCTMQLVRSDAHTRIAGMTHSGSVAQMKAYTGNNNLYPY